MSKPSSDCVDVYPRSKKMRRCAVSNHVRADLLRCNRRRNRARSRCVALDQSMDSEARDWLAVAVLEQPLIWLALRHQ